MKVHPRAPSAFSSTVGSSVVLEDERGRSMFMIMACGVSDGIDARQSRVILGAVFEALKDGLDVPEKEEKKA